MINKKSWIEFKETGLIWWINTILHTFGWAIVIEMDNDEVVSVYPARVKFRGFSEKSNTEGYKKVAKYNLDHAEELLKEAEE